MTSPLKLQMCLGEQMVTEPHSTNKSVETSESVSASASQADNQLPTEDLRPLKLPLEAASELQASKLEFQKSTNYAFLKKLCKEELQVAIFQRNKQTVAIKAPCFQA